jgi:hypothetical protein
MNNPAGKNRTGIYTTLTDVTRPGGNELFRLVWLNRSRASFRPSSNDGQKEKYIFLQV